MHTTRGLTKINYHVAKELIVASGALLARATFKVSRFLAVFSGPLLHFECQVKGCIKPLNFLRGGNERQVFVSAAKAAAIKKNRCRDK
jgi:hypothetical protein